MSSSYLQLESERVNRAEWMLDLLLGQKCFRIILECRLLSLIVWTATLTFCPLDKTIRDSDCLNKKSGLSKPG